MNDLLPEFSAHWQYVEKTLAAVMSQYGYREVRFPIVESTELFKRSIGEVTDIVEKEMYTFNDRNEDSLTLRPEGTAGCVRMCLQHGLLDNQNSQRLWYTGPMFRYERPQKGRLRQFHQFGVEAFGMSGPDIDAELIILTARLWRRFGVMSSLRLELNSIGSQEARQRYRAALVSFLSAHREELDEDSQRRLETNPLRILDSKNTQTQSLLDGAPVFTDYLDDESVEHFQHVQQLLDAAGVPYSINPRLVRGLDYYSKTVFEWVTDKLGAQGTVCAGGRYDGLLEQLGSKPVPAVGFAMGIERLLLLLEVEDVLPALPSAADIYCIVGGIDAESTAMLLTEQLRTEVPDIKVMMHCGGGSFKSQFKRADKSAARLALIIGDDEAANQTVTVKFLREEQPQKTIPQQELLVTIKSILSIN